jgi:hypothetical protein
MTAHTDESFEGIEFDTPFGSFRAGRGFDVSDEEYRSARRRVRRVFGFYKHAATFVTVLLVLLAVDLIADADDFFVHWVALIWGIILALHFLNVFVFDRFISREAENRMIERELRKRGRSGQ